MQLLTLAKIIAGRVEAEATLAGVPVATTVIDAGGEMVLQHRMAGAPVHAVAASERKAYTSALVQKRTAELGRRTDDLTPDYTPTAVGGGRYCVVGGGVPVRVGGALVAAVGVSGGTADEDVAIVEAALAGLTRERCLARSSFVHNDEAETAGEGEAVWMRQVVVSPAHP